MESSFKELFTTIYKECLQLVQTYDKPEWNHLQSNPLFSSTFLTRILKLYMPTAPIWSNLLLGDFAHRYGYVSDSTPAPCSCHFGRTTGTSENQMRVLKENILCNKKYSRIDQVVTKLGESIEAMEMQYADYSLLKRTKNRLLPSKKKKPAQEPWNKRKRATRKTGLYTSEGPKTNLITMMNTRLLGQNDDKLLGKYTRKKLDV
jgi:hypothetical protein